MMRQTIYAAACLLLPGLVFDTHGTLNWLFIRWVRVPARLCSEYAPTESRMAAKAKHNQNSRAENTSKGTMIVLINMANGVTHGRVV